jgi:uncharacterized protein YacL
MTDTTIKALLVAFAAGFSIQQLLEILDPPFSLFLTNQTVKKSVLGLLSLAIGLLVAWKGQIHIFQLLSASTTTFPTELDTFLTAVFISAGTEGFNSLLKFANYKKEEAKTSAAAQKSKLSPQELSSVNFQKAVS